MDKTHKNLFIFDFDDTLVTCDSCFIFVVDKAGKTLKLSTSNWSDYTPSPGDTFDFSELETLVNPAKILPVWNIFEARIQKHGAENVIILTARGDAKPVEKYLKDNNIQGVCVVGLGIRPGENNGVWKSRWIEKDIKKHKHTYIEFYDDRDDNIGGIKHLTKNHPGIEFRVYQVKNKEEVVECF